MNKIPSIKADVKQFENIQRVLIAMDPDSKLNFTHMTQFEQVKHLLVTEKVRCTEEVLARTIGTTGATIRSYISRLRDQGYAIAKRARFGISASSTTFPMLPAEYFHVSHSEDTPSNLVARRCRYGRTSRRYADMVQLNFR